MASNVHVEWSDSEKKTMLFIAGAQVSSDARIAA